MNVITPEIVSDLMAAPSIVELAVNTSNSTPLEAHIQEESKTDN